MSILSAAARGLMVVGQVTEPVIYSLLWAAGIIAVFAPLSMRAFRRGCDATLGLWGSSKPRR